MIKDVNDMRREDIDKLIYQGWYRIPSMSGLYWELFYHGKKKAEIHCEEPDKGDKWEVWIGRMDDDEPDTIGFTTSWSKAEKLAEKWMEKHPKG